CWKSRCNKGCGSNDGVHPGQLSLTYVKAWIPRAPDMLLCVLLCPSLTLKPDGRIRAGRGFPSLFLPCSLLGQATECSPKHFPEEPRVLADLPWLNICSRILAAAARRLPQWPPKPLRSRFRTRRNRRRDISKARQCGGPPAWIDSTQQATARIQMPKQKTPKNQSDTKWISVA